MRRGASIREVLKPMSSGIMSQCYISDFVQAADVLDWVLSQLGACDVYQTSFSISDEFLRRLFFIRKKGAVRSFNLVLDHKATNKTIKLWPFVRQVVDDCRLADNHSKVMIMVPADGKSKGVAVVTSQNLTRGNRFESTLVSQDPGVVVPLMADFIDIFNNHTVPLNELFEARIGGG